MSSSLGHIFAAAVSSVLQQQWRLFQDHCFPHWHTWKTCHQKLTRIQMLQLTENPRSIKTFFWHLEWGTRISVYEESFFHKYSLQKIIDVSFNRNIF